MITRDEAFDIAAAHLRRLSNMSGIELQLMDKETLEKDFGWVFFYNSHAFLSFGDSHQVLAGNAPFIVDKRDGTIHETGTAEPLDSYLDRYQGEREKERKKRGRD